MTHLGNKFLSKHLQTGKPGNAFRRVRRKNAAGQRQVSRRAGDNLPGRGMWIACMPVFSIPYGTEY
jgi:hypothetical protein